MKNNKKVLIPIPSYGFDPTEVAIPWKLLVENNIQVIFATPKGEKAECDELMILGKNLGIFKQILQARQDAKDAYWDMYSSQEYNKPIAYESILEQEYDSIYLPGGHHKGVKEYLESNVLQNIIPQFFKNKKIIGAICHGTILLARSKSIDSENSVLYNYKTTSLLKSQEMLAYNMTRLWLKDYYLTYPEITVEDEVKSVLKNKSQFILGPKPIFRDSINNLKKGFVLRDKNYVSARWPGDIYNFSLKYIQMVLGDNIKL